MPELPFSLASKPALDSWISFDTGDGVIVSTGKVELGQGIRTAIASIAAIELSIAMERVDVVQANTVDHPNEGITAGSMSIQMTGAAVRQACAEVRALAIAQAAQKLGIDEADVHLHDGQLGTRGAGANASISYADLFAGGINADANGQAKPLPAAPAPRVGRIDLPGKLAGAAAFIQDEVRPNTLHARVVRHRTPGTVIEELDESGTRRLAGVVAIVRNGNFLAVIADTEASAERAAAHLAVRVRWGTEPELRPEGPAHLMSSVTHSLLLDDNGAPTDATIPPRASAGQTLKAAYWKPYHLHGSIAPSAAAALVEGDQLTVWSHAQGPYLLRGALADVLNMPTPNISIYHRENAGCYGHNGADDAALDAALAAQAVPNRRVLLKYTRADEHQNEPLSPATCIELEASFADGAITHWNADVYTETHSGRPLPGQEGSNLRAAWDLEKPIARTPVVPGRGPHGGIHRNADPYYNFASRRVVKHLCAPRVRTSSTRGLGAYANVFAIESFIDEIAHANNRDPAEFRLAHVDDPRAYAVIAHAQQALTTWRPRMAANMGCGMAFARYKNVQTWCAVAVLLSVDPANAKVALLETFIAADAGRVVDPDGLAHQLEGGFVQSASWSLKEAVHFDKTGRTTTDWESYPILRFSEVPRINVQLLDHPGEPSLGAGEASTGPTPAAIANAIFDATEIRVRTVPFTPANLRSAAAN